MFLELLELFLKLFDMHGAIFASRMLSKIVALNAASLRFWSFPDVCIVISNLGISIGLAKPFVGWCDFLDVGNLVSFLPTALQNCIVENLGVWCKDADILNSIRFAAPSIIVSKELIVNLRTYTSVREMMDSSAPFVAFR